jgi:hypothetical protein
MIKDPQRTNQIFGIQKGGGAIVPKRNETGEVETLE